MTDAQIDSLVAEIDRMAQQVGCRFIPDPEKLLAFRCAQREEQAMRDYFRSEAAKSCPKCGGDGWLWWDELDQYFGPAIETGQDDTRYSCDHECHRDNITLGDQK